MMRPKRLAQKTQLGSWGHGESDEAECEDDTGCGWEAERGTPRMVEYAARRHVDQTGHVVIRYRVMSQAVFLADDEPAR